MASNSIGYWPILAKYNNMESSMLFDLLRKSFKGTIVITCLILLTGSVKPTQLEIAKMSGSLYVVTRNSPVAFFEDRTGKTGFEYELAKAFADSLNLDLQFIVADSVQDIFQSLTSNNASFAAAGLTRSDEREQTLKFTTPYITTNELVIYRRGGIKPSSPEDLTKGRLMVIGSSVHAERLRNWQLETPELTWTESSETETADLLQLLSAGDIDFTLVNANEFKLLQAYYPSLSVAFTLEEEREIAWAFPRNNDDSLYEAANEFLQSIEDTQLMASLSERFFGHLDRLDYVGAQRFTRLTNNKLDQYKEHFVEAAEANKFDWRLLAAVSYQESHWNPRAKSFTGVRGMMMLTLPTAKELGVKNRLDPKQSIEGGARYLSKLRDRLKDVPEPDRTWLALAAYNVGYGHLRDARKITELEGGNPNLWMDVKQSLPLLSQKRYYKYTRHGYARGQEPVDYVQNIRRYYDVLVWNDEQPGIDAKNIALSVSHVPPLL